MNHLRVALKRIKAARDNWATYPASKRMTLKVGKLEYESFDDWAADLAEEALSRDSHPLLIASSPFMIEPATMPFRVGLFMVEDSKGNRQFHTHRQDIEGNCFWGRYSQHDFDKSYADWMELTKEQHERYRLGIIERGAAFIPYFEKGAEGGV